MRSKSAFARYVLSVVATLALSACGSVGSCLFTTPSGYDICEDFVGSEYDSSAAQNTCSTGSGAYSSGACATAGALGTCDVGAGSAQNYRYTYLPDGPSDAGVASIVTLESACGVAGGTFTSG